MPRVNVYLPQDVYELADKWRDSTSLSEICANALRDEFYAREMHRAPPAILKTLQGKSALERALADRYGLADVVLCEAELGDTALYEAIGDASAKYLDENICDESQIAIAGGRQIWCMVRRLSPRRVRTSITALGLHYADPRYLHVHPNSLATFLWLLYGPRSQAHLIGAQTSDTWINLPAKSHPSYFVFSSCSALSSTSSFAELLGEGPFSRLTKANAFGDFAYAFFDRHGGEIRMDASGVAHRLLGYQQLRQLSGRPDARTVLVAGGKNKLDAIEQVLRTSLANVLISDTITGETLLERSADSRKLPVHDTSEHA